MDNALYETASVLARAASAEKATRPPIYKVVGVCLAVCSGLFIGCSFVLKKVGLLKANVKYNEEAGKGYGYLKNGFWWTGMTLMILGEICNFVAYAFTDAILVTPLGALSVVITTILSAIFLKERLSFVGKIGCFMCIVGSVIIPLNAPEQSAVANIQEMQHYVIQSGFLTFAGIILAGCAFTAWWVGPRYGNKTMMVYLTICSLIGGLSVVSTQGLGAAILAQISGEKQFNKWFLYVLFVFVVGTLLTEIIYLNKALNIFNAALVTPTYYVYFTTSTIVTSAVLFQGFHGTPTQIVDVVLGFLVICSGVILLQLAKSSKDVPDAAVFQGDLDQVRTVAEVEEPEYEPRADAIRGGAGIVRVLSKTRARREVDELKRIHDEHMAPIGENETVEWDGLRRRKTVSSAGFSNVGGSLQRKKTVHPPLGMSHFPDDISEPDSEVHPGFFGRIGRRSHTSSSLSQRNRTGVSPVPLSHVAGKEPSTAGLEEHVYGLPPGLQRHESESTGSRSHQVSFADPNPRSVPRPPPHIVTPTQSLSSNDATQRRQFSFQNVVSRFRNGAGHEETDRPSSSRHASSRGRRSVGSRGDNSYPANTSTTEEERLGLVAGENILRGDTSSEEEPRSHALSTIHLSSSPDRLTPGRSPSRSARDGYEDHSDEEGLFTQPLRSPISREDDAHDRAGRQIRGAFM